MIQFIKSQITFLDLLMVNFTCHFHHDNIIIKLSSGVSAGPLCKRPERLNSL